VHRPDQQTGTDEQRQRQRRLNHRHRAQQLPLAEACAAARAAVLQRVDGIHPRRAQRRHESRQHRRKQRGGQTAHQQRPAGGYGIEAWNRLAANQFEDLYDAERQRHAGDPANQRQRCAFDTDLPEERHPADAERGATAYSC
jgi:hypothetical protein